MINKFHKQTSICRDDIFLMLQIEHCITWKLTCFLGDQGLEIRKFGVGLFILLGQPASSPHQHFQKKPSFDYWRLISLFFVQQERCISWMYLYCMLSKRCSLINFILHFWSLIKLSALKGCLTSLFHSLTTFLWYRKFAARCTWSSLNRGILPLSAH